jgi:hypothetical protein
MKRPIITLLTDFGLADHYVAAMKGVILGICPEAQLVDISHEITPFSIEEGAYTLAQAWECFPKGTIHLAVVDPGVGTSREPVVISTMQHFFVVPNNGLITLVLKTSHVYKTTHITNARFFRKPVSDTFHGRDIFAPVAAHLAKGLSPSRFGPALAEPLMAGFEKPKPIGAGRWRGVVLKIDNFGNIITNLDWNTCGKIATSPFQLRIGRTRVSHFSNTYGDVPAGQLFVLKGSSEYVEVSLNQSNAAAKLRVAPGSPIELRIGRPQYYLL